MSVPVIYHTGSNVAGTESKSFEVCLRIQDATGFPLRHVKDFEVGTLPITYGLFRDTDRIMRKAYWSGVGFWYVDHGFWDRGHYNGNYRFVYNGMWPNAVVGNRPLKPWQHTTKPSNYDTLPPMRPFNGTGIIVLCAPAYEGSMNLPFIKMQPEEWIEGITYRLQAKYPKANVVVSTKHPGNRLVDGWLDKATLVVCHDSNALITALFNGTPACNLSYDSWWTTEPEYKTTENLFIVNDDRDRRVMINILSRSQSKLEDLKPEWFV